MIGAVVKWIVVPFGDAIAEVDGREVGRVKDTGRSFVAIADGHADFGFKTERAARRAVIKRLRQARRRVAGLPVRRWD